MRQKYNLSKSCQRLSVLLILFLSILQSCGISSLFGGNNYKFEIGDAKTLFIASQPLHTRGIFKEKTLTENKIFKATESGATLEVNLTNDLGIIVSGKTMNPVAILPAGEEYLLFCFGTGNEFRYYVNDAYLVNRSTGAAFQIQSEYLPVYVDPADQYHLAVSPIQSDGDGNLYWIFNVFDNSVRDGFYHAIAKISGLSGTDVIIRRVTSSNDFVISFIVDRAGNLVYKYPTTTHARSRLLTKTNNIYNLGELVSIYVSLSGNIRYVTRENPQFFLNTIIANNDNTVSFQKENVSTINWGVQEYFFKIGTEIYKFGLFLPAQYRAESGSVLFETIEFEELTEISSIKASVNKAYFSGMDNTTSKLISFTPPNVFETLLPGHDGIQYDISRFEVSSDDEISFSALRLRDNKRVLGTIDALKQIIIIGEEGDSTISSLIQVN